MSKKVGIITYHRSQNYGAQLQAYALRKVVEKLGCDAEVIDCNTIGENKGFEWHWESPRSIAGAIRNNILRLFGERKRNKKIQDFSQIVIKRSMACLDRKSLDKLITTYDYVITGSDQVWHPNICEGNTLFFLDLPIPNDRKIAYAPSFGVSDYTAMQASQYMPLIKEIKHLSVREESGADMIKKYTGRDAEIVLDPTMLLYKKDWEEIALPVRNDRYLLYFTILDEPIGCDAMVRKIAKEKGLKIVRIGQLKDVIKKGFINARANGPKEFLGLVKSAEFIVTSSFHGSVFSILFERDFIIVLNNNDRNSRLTTLATRLGLSDHIVADVNKFNIGNYIPIKYQDVDARMDILRSSSLRYLRKALSL